MIELRLYKRQRDNHYFEDVIWLFQKLVKDPDPERIHAELAFVGSQFGVRAGQMFSSSGRGGFLGVGTRFVSSKIDEEKWDIFPLTLTVEEELRILAECEKYTGFGYDWLAIIGMALPFNMQLNKYWYCSEICNHVLNLVGVADKNRKLRPSQMLKEYQKQGLIKI